MRGPGREGLSAGTVTGREGFEWIPAGQGWMQPDNGPARNMRLWYDISAMAAQAWAGSGNPLPVVIEAGDAPNPGSFPIGGQTNVNIANITCNTRSRGTAWRLRLL